MRSPGRVGARAWCRADLAGGTLDIWPLGLLHRGACTVNVALDLPVRVEVAHRKRGFRIIQGKRMVEAPDAEALADHADTALIGMIARHFELAAAEITVRSASPRGGGLGASSALTVAMIAAAERMIGLPESSSDRRAALARDLEAQLMSLPTGCQDHYPALLGGVLKIELRPGGKRVTGLEVDHEALTDSLIVCFTGQSHFSAGNNWQVVRRRLDGDRDTVGRFDAIAETAQALAKALEQNDLETVGKMMSREWGQRRGLAPEVSTRRIEDLLVAAREAGAWGGKACGAGGGGCLAILAPAAARSSVEAALERGGARMLAARPARGPLQTLVF